MKFHRITLRDYRGIRAVTIEPGETGVTIIEGENEVGKSSIAEALWLIFEQHDDSMSQAVKNLKPAGRDAATDVEVDVSTGPYRFTYSKRFHRGSRTELVLTEPRREVLTGREAHNRARQILDETIDRTLWEALRVQQGASLELLDASQHQSLLRALDVAAGKPLGGDREQTLFERIEGEYLKYFTASGREKAAGDGPNVVKLRRAQEAAAAEVARIASRIDSLDERAAAAAQLAGQIGEFEASRDRLRATRDNLATKHEARQALVDTVRRLSGRIEILDAGARELAGAIRARDDAQRALEERSGAFSGQEKELSSLDQPLERARQEAESAQTALADAATATAEGQAGVDRAEALVRIAEKELQAAQMAERFERVARSQPELSEVVAWLNACRIDRRALQEIEGAEKEVARREAASEAAGASIEVSSPEAVSILIDGMRADLGPGRPVAGKVPGETTLGLPGGIVVTVRAGAHARELESSLAEARRLLTERLAAAGVESAQAARDAWSERVRNEERRRALQEQIRGDLRDLSPDGLREKLERESVAIDALRAEQAGELPSSLDEAKAKRDEAMTALRAADEGGRRAADAYDDARRRLESLERDHIQKSARLATLKEEILRAEAEVTRLGREGATEELRERLAAQRREIDSQIEALAGAQKQKDAVEDVSAEFESAAAELRRLDAAIQQASVARAGHTSILEEAGAEGLHGQLVEAQQQEEVARADLEAFERRAAAARALYEAMRTRRDEARESYQEPLRREIERLGRKVLGESLQIELSDDLRIARVSRDGVALEFGQLSVGLREQLSVLTRLACAGLVSTTGGAPVILDDVFGWADPGRLARLGPVLAEAAKDTQVLLFTCSPGRFKSVLPARIISLPSGAATDRSASASAPPAAVVNPARRVPSAGQEKQAPQATFDLFAEPETAAKR